MTDRRGWLRQAASLAVLLAGCAQQAPAPAPQAESLRIMTFNIRYGTADDGADAWPHRRDLVIQVIRDGRPDLLGVQEALRFQLDELGVAVPGYGEIGVGRDDGRTKGEYAAFLYRKDRLEPLASGTHWFSDTPEVPGSTSWGNRITRIVTWARFRDRTTGRAFAAYNLHLDHESQPSRERSAEMIARLVAAEDVPVVVLGDFNSGEANPAFRRLTAGGGGTPPPLRDTYRILHPADSVVGTFNGFRGDSTGDKIDHILVGAGWRVEGASIVRRSAGSRYPSDHFPVTAVLRPE